jgi:SAM-dependent methyltransferase
VIDHWLKVYLKDVRADTILDVGPGYNHFSRVVAKVTGATEVTYLDFDQAILTFQVEEARRVGLNAISVSELLLPDKPLQLPGKYDIILCQEVLEHLGHAEQVLQMLANHLTDSGRIVITVPTRLSERLLKFVNSNYLANEPYGHVREFSEQSLRQLVSEAGLKPIVLFPVQPHYFVSHLWLFGSRMQVEGSSGKVLTQDWRAKVLIRLLRTSEKVFAATGPKWWGRLFPRNYFLIAQKDS